MNPKVYTHGHHASVLSAHNWRTADNSAAFLLPHLKPDMTILDVGYGPGTITVDLARYVPEGKIVGIEIVDTLVEACEKLAAEKGVTNVEFRGGYDVHKLPFPDNSFDVVFAHQVLQHVADPVQALREMKRVAKVGGLVAARDADYDGFLMYPRRAGIKQALDLYKTIARSNGGEPLMGCMIQAKAREAGYEPGKMTLSSATWCFATRHLVEWWGGLWAERYQKSNLRDTCLANGVGTQADLDAASRAWTEWCADEDAWTTIVHGEMLYEK